MAGTLRRLIVLAGLIAGLIWIASLAMADTDYRCLNRCVNNGGASGDCMKQCSYALPTAPLQDSVPTGNITVKPLDSPSTSARQFSTPVPLAGQIILPKPKVQEVVPQVDYACVAKCQQDGNQYKYCNEQCVKPADPYSHSVGQGTNQYLK